MCSIKLGSQGAHTERCDHIEVAINSENVPGSNTNAHFALLSIQSWCGTMLRQQNPQSLVAAGILW